MVVLHATDPATVFLSAIARTAEPSIEAIERALYEDRSLVRTLAMRRTLFVASREVLPIVESSSTPAVAAVRTYTWHLRDRWLGHEPSPLAPAVARAELVRRWLATFGPGTMTDLKWWTKWKVGEVTDALAGTGAVEVELDRGTGWVLPDDLEPSPRPGPWAALLPSLDPTPMGWKERGWFLGPHDAPLFDRNGNIGPTVWVDGRIVGGWGQRPDGEVVTELLEDVGAEHRALIDAEVDRLGDCIGETVVKPSFPTPLQQQISGS